MYRLLALLLLTTPLSGWAADDRQQELGDLRARIAELREEVEQASEDRKEAADGLRDSEKRISEVNRNLAELRRGERRLAAALGQLAGDRRTVEARLRDQEDALAELVRQRYRQGDVDAMRLLLSGRNPADVQRDLGYYAYIGRARAALIESHRATLAELAEIEERTQKRKAEMVRVKQAQLAQHDQLSQEKLARQAVVDRLSSQISQQRRQIATLVRDEQRLARLIERLRKLAEEAKAKKAARERELRRAGQVKKGEPVSRVADASLAGFRFSSLRGRLALPTVGEIVARFGQSRSGGGPAWKGLFIKAPAGQPVRAVGSGEVVFSDWLRGFGNLLIVDHGDGYLSLYSNNESLYKQAGDTVKAGDVIASTGNTGGHEEPGLYFELRRQGQPFDPLSWVK